MSYHLRQDHLTVWLSPAHMHSLHMQVDISGCTHTCACYIGCCSSGSPRVLNYVLCIPSSDVLPLPLSRNINKLDNYWPSLSLLKNKHIEACIPSEALISTTSYFSKFANYKHFRGTIYLDTCCSHSALNLFQTCKSFLIIAIQQQNKKKAGKCNTQPNPVYAQGGSFPDFLARTAPGPCQFSTDSDQTCLEQKTDNTKRMTKGGVESIIFSNRTLPDGKRTAMKQEGWHMADLCKNKGRRERGSLPCPGRKGSLVAKSFTWNTAI